MKFSEPAVAAYTLARQFVRQGSVTLFFRDLLAPRQNPFRYANPRAPPLGIFDFTGYKAT